MSRYISLDWLNAHTNYICERGRKGISRIIYADKLNDAPTIRTKQIKYFDEDEKIWKIGEVIVDE